MSSDFFALKWSADAILKAARPSFQRSLGTVQNGSKKQDNKF
jgi:hypothetical protein